MPLTHYPGSDEDDQPTEKPHAIDPTTGIWPIREWGGECARGFVGSERFARGGERVIKRTARKRSTKNARQQRSRP